MIRHVPAALAVVAVPMLWLQRAPHWSIPFAALAFALLSSASSRRWIGFGLFAAYFALWALMPVDAHRSFQLSVLRLPAMDCNDLDACADGAVEWSRKVYGEDVDG